ncbi:transposable element Tcb1 transposase [Trichonephila clavipes]|nr:transposable element Tcb1 transposase [Trichonephila clavipes]
MLNSCVMHRHTGPAPGIMGLATTIFQQDNARPHVACIVQRFFVNHEIELIPLPACSPYLPPIENMWFVVAQRLTQFAPPAATPDQPWQHVEAAWSAVPQEHIQSLFESMPRRVAAVISNNGGYSGYRIWQEPHFTEVYKFNHYILGQHDIYKINFVVLSLVFLGVAFTNNTIEEMEKRLSIWIDDKIERSMLLGQSTFLIKRQKIENTEETE